RREQIKEQGIRRHHDLAQVVLHQRAEHDRPQALLLGRTVDAPYGFLRLVKARHKWQSHRPKFLSLELRHETVAQCFRGHTRLVGNEEYGSTAHGAGVLIKAAAMSPQCFTRRAPIVSSSNRMGWMRASAPSLPRSTSMTWRGSPPPERASVSGFSRHPFRRP